MLDVNEVQHNKKQIEREINEEIHQQKNDKLYYLENGLIIIIILSPNFLNYIPTSFDFTKIFVISQRILLICS